MSPHIDIDFRIMIVPPGVCPMILQGLPIRRNDRASSQGVFRLNFIDVVSEFLDIGDLKLGYEDFRKQWTSAYTAAECEETEVLLEEPTYAEVYVDALRSPFGECSRVCSKRPEAGSSRHRNDDLPRNLLRDSRSRQNDGSRI